jgi:large subunit ribosomal protein L20
MPRVKRGKAHLKRRRKLLKKVKGYHWGRKKLIKIAKTAVTKAGVHAYTDRKKKKRRARGLWLIKINAALREKGLNWSKFVYALKQKNIGLDRKTLADLAENEPEIFEALLRKIKGE